MPTLKERILGAADCKSIPVSVPEWGLETGLFLREIPAADMDRYQVAANNARLPDGKIAPGTSFRPLLVQLALVDETGKPVFAADEVEKLGAKSSAVIDRLYWEAHRLNFLSSEDAEKN